MVQDNKGPAEARSLNLNCNLVKTCKLLLKNANVELDKNLNFPPSALY